jgi:hypothetical protein
LISRDIYLSDLPASLRILLVLALEESFQDASQSGRRAGASRKPYKDLM